MINTVYLKHAVSIFPSLTLHSNQFFIKETTSGIELKPTNEWRNVEVFFIPFENIACIAYDNISVFSKDKKKK